VAACSPPLLTHKKSISRDEVLLRLISCVIGNYDFKIVALVTSLRRFANALAGVTGGVFLAEHSMQFGVIVTASKLFMTPRLVIVVPSGGRNVRYFRQSAEGATEGNGAATSILAGTVLVIEFDEPREMLFVSAQSTLRSIARLVVSERKALQDLEAQYGQQPKSKLTRSSGSP
jgi:hypothetical protein